MTFAYGKLCDLHRCFKLVLCNLVCAIPLAYAKLEFARVPSLNKQTNKCYVVDLKKNNSGIADSRTVARHLFQARCTHTDQHNISLAEALAAGAAEADRVLVDPQVILWQGEECDLRVEFGSSNGPSYSTGEVDNLLQ